MSAYNWQVLDLLREAFGNAPRSVLDLALLVADSEQSHGFRGILGRRRKEAPSALPPEPTPDCLEQVAASLDPCEVLCPGNAYVVRVRSPVAGYLELFNCSSDGRCVVLAPGVGSTPARLPAGQAAYVIRGGLIVTSASVTAGQGYRYNDTGHGELLLARLSKTPVDFFPDALRGLQNANADHSFVEQMRESTLAWGYLELNGRSGG